MKVVTDYSYALDILDKYDHQDLIIEGTADQQLFHATYEAVIQAIKKLKDKLVAVHYLGMKRTILLKDRLVPSINRLAVWIFIQP